MRLDSLKPLGIALFVFLLIAGHWRSCHGVDLMPPYAGSRAMLEGREMYAPGVTQEILLRDTPAELRTPAYLAGNNLDCNAYPPSNALFLLPFAAFPFATARTLLYFVTAAIMHFGIWRLMAQFSPRWSIVLRLLILVLAQQSMTVRWSLGMLQIAPVLLGLFALFLVSLSQDRVVAPILLTALAFGLKPTMGLPFLLILLAQRQFRSAVCSGLICAGVNGLCFWRVGGWHAFIDYTQHLAANRALPINAPNPYLPLAWERLDWEYLLNGFHPAPPIMRLVGMLVSLCALGILVFLAVRYKGSRTSLEFLAAISSSTVCFGLLCMYHHKYDAALLLAPLLMSFLVAPAPSTRIAVRAFQGFTLALAVLYPVYRPLSVPLGRLTGIAPLLIERLSPSLLLTGAFIASLVVLGRIEPRLKPRSAKTKPACAG